MDNNNWIKQLMMLGVGTATSLVSKKLREVSGWDGKQQASQDVY